MTLSTDIKDLSDALVASSSVKWGMGGGAATSLLGSISSNDWMVIAGIVFTAFGFVVNTYYQHKRNKLAEIAAKQEEEEHRKRMELLQQQIEASKNEQKANS